VALITVDDVQSWFTENRLQLDITDELVEEPNISAEVLGTVSSRYDVSTWTTYGTTPDLIRSVISARVAAVRYRKHYADQADELFYADWLDEWATNLLDGIVSGTVELLDVTDEETTAAQTAAGPSFVPNDLTEETSKFTMDMSF
jgi:hypothetical protein